VQHAYAMLAITIFACCPGSFNILSLVGWLCGGGGGGGWWVRWGHLGLHIIVTSCMAIHHESVASNISLQRIAVIVKFSHFPLLSFDFFFFFCFFFIIFKFFLLYTIKSGKSHFLYQDLD
jgi:hypothetical protein